MKFQEAFEELYNRNVPIRREGWDHFWFRVFIADDRYAIFSKLRSTKKKKGVIIGYAHATSEDMMADDWISLHDIPEKEMEVYKDRDNRFK
jgi:hypothetical protein